MITVILPIHEALEMFLEAYRRVTEQIGASDQVVIVADFCKKATLTTLKELVLMRPQTSLIRTELFTTQISNPNLGEGINLGLDEVRAADRAALIVESDVWLEPGCVEALVRHLDTQKEAGLATPLFLHRDGDTIAHCFPGQRGQNPPLLSQILKDEQLTHDYLTPRTVGWTHFSCCMMPGDVARNSRVRVDPFFRLWCADFDYCWRIEDETELRLWYVPNARAVHTPHQSSKRLEGKDWTKAPYSLLTEAEYNRIVREKHHREHF